MAPVIANSVFFVAVVLLGAITPLCFVAVEHGRIFRFLAYAGLQSVFLAYVFCAILYAVRKHSMVVNAVKWTVISIMSLWAAVEVGSIAATGMPVVPSSLALILETDLYEIKGFLAQYFCVKVILVYLATVVVVASGAFLFSKLLLLIARCRVGVCATAVIMLSVLIYGCVHFSSILRMALMDNYADFQLWEGVSPENQHLIRATEMRFSDPVSKMVYLYKSVTLQMADFDRWSESQLEALEVPCASPSGNDFNVVVVIGESFIRAHCSLYGYYLDVNPRLTDELEQGRLVVFSDMLSTANFTTPSIRNMMNLNDISAGEKWYDSVYFPVLLKKADWNIYWYDNQCADSNFNIGLGSMLYASVNMEHVYDGVSDKMFPLDGEFLDYVHGSLSPREQGGRRAVFYHLWGQHFPYKSRYSGPPHFSASDITVERPWLTDKHRAEIAAYDNATLYNDSILYAIIEHWRERPTVMFYFSDHGEDMWDLCEIKSRNNPAPGDSSWLDRQYRIPFMVWMSDSFMDGYADKAAALRRAASTPGMMDNFGQIVLGLCGIETPFYRPERDMLNHRYVRKERITSEGYHFDAGQKKAAAGK